MSDEGFREIQLNGKQLVFLFMAATVVLVVTFLFGIMVGRGVPGAEPAPETTSAEVSPDTAREPLPEMPASPPPAGSSPGTAPTTSEPSPKPDDVTYPKRLLEDKQAEEKLKEKPAVQSKPAPKPPPAAAAPSPATPPPTSSAPVAAAPARGEAQPSRAAPVAASDPSGPGFAVQVAISKDRREADTLAKELVAKGYPAFVMDPAKGAPVGIYRVRVGKYKTRKDAEEIAARLKSVEQFDPWIAR